MAWPEQRIGEYFCGTVDYIIYSYRDIYSYHVVEYLEYIRKFVNLLNQNNLS